MEFVLGLVLGLAYVVAMFVGGGLLYLAAVWLNAHMLGPGLFGRYAKWVLRKEAQIKARAEAPAETGASLPPTEANGGS